MKFSRWDEKQEQGVWICDTPAEAKSCQSFSCRYNKEKLKTAFKEEVLDNPDKLSQDYKDIGILMWVLGNPVPRTSHWSRIKTYLQVFRRPPPTTGSVPRPLSITETDAQEIHSMMEEKTQEIPNGE